MNPPPHTERYFLPHYQDVRRFMMTYCRWMLGEDHVQSAYIRLTDRNSDPYPEDSDHRGLFFTSAIRDCKSSCRRAHARKTQVVTESVLGAEFSLDFVADGLKWHQLEWLCHLEEQSSRGKALQKAISSLRREQPSWYELFKLRHVDEISAHEISQLLKTPVRTVFSDIAKALKFLRMQLVQD